MYIVNRVLVKLHASLVVISFQLGCWWLVIWIPRSSSGIKQGIAMKPQYLNSSLNCHLIEPALFHKDVTRFGLEHCGCGDIPG